MVRTMTSLRIKAVISNWYKFYTKSKCQHYMSTNFHFQKMSTRKTNVYTHFNGFYKFSTKKLMKINSEFSQFKLRVYQ